MRATSDPPTESEELDGILAKIRQMIPACTSNIILETLEFLVPLCVEREKKTAIWIYWRNSISQSAFSSWSNWKTTSAIRWVER